MSRAWMPFYGGDFIANTLHLSRGEIGSYILLLWHHWEHGSIPDDSGQCRRIARVNDANHWPQIWSRLRPLFQSAPDSPGRLIQGRLLAELSKTEEISNKRKAAALQKHSKSSASAVHLHTQSQSQSQREEKEEREEVARSARSVARGTVCPSDFTPSPDHYAAGAALGFSSLDVDELAADMRNWSAANANRAVARKLDWSATFCNWIKRKSQERGPNDAKETRRSKSELALAKLGAFANGPTGAIDGGFGQKVVQLLPQPSASGRSGNISDESDGSVRGERLL